MPSPKGGFTIIVECDGRTHSKYFGPSDLGKKSRVRKPCHCVDDFIFQVLEVKR